MSDRHRKRGSSDKKGGARFGRGKKRRPVAAAEGHTPPNRGKEHSGEKMPVKPVSGWRLWLFRGIAVFIAPVFVLLLIELGLRLAGYGYPTGAIIKQRINGKLHYCDNPKFNRRFFPKNIARQFDPFAFAVDKSADTYRVFVLGSSAAQGTPDGAFSFSRILREMLRESYPQVNFEVINAAATAINSHVVLEIMKDCAVCRGDLFIVYMGNNEVTGPYGPGTVFSPFSGNLTLIRLGIALKSTRLGQLLSSLTACLRGRQPLSWRGLEMFTERQVRADDNRLGTVYKHFLKNLEDITRAARKAEADLILCTVGTNLKDCPPFASLHRADLTDAETKEWDSIYKEGAELEAAGSYAEAITRYLKAAEIDDSFAALQFRLGRCYWRSGEYGKAKDRYVLAQELDTLRIRADKRINQIIRDAASEGGRGVYLVDSANYFESNSPYGAAGEELFYEHVHLNFHGNYLLANSIYQQIERILPQHIAKKKASEDRLLNEEDCAQRLIHTDWVRLRILENLLASYIKRAPFTNQLYHKEQVAKMEKEAEALRRNLTPAALLETAEQYRAAIENDSTDWWLRWRYMELLWEGLKEYEAVAVQCRWVVNSLPHYSEGHVKLGAILLKLGQADEAISSYLEALRIAPTAGTHFDLAVAYQGQGRLDEAHEQYSRALALEPDHLGANMNLGALLYEQGRMDEAIKVYQKALVLRQDSVDLHFNLGVLYYKKGRTADAIRELEAALKIEPDSAQIRSMLDTLRGRGR